MGKRRQDADARRFLDEFACVNVSRFRAMGIIDPAKREAVIPFPNGKQKLLGVQHVKFWNGGGYSYFVCPGCSTRARKLYLLDDAARCIRCCAAMNIHHVSRMGFGRQARRQAADRHLDELIAKLNTSVPLRYKPAPANCYGKAKRVLNSRKLTARMRRSMVALRIKQIAYQDAKSWADRKDTLKTHLPSPEARSLIQLKPIWQAKTRADLEIALDKAQHQIISALQSNDPEIRMNAARLMLRTKQARDRGIV